MKRISLYRPPANHRPLVLLHGTFGTRFSLAGIVRRLRSQRPRLKVLDLKVAKNGKVSTQGRFRWFSPQEGPLIRIVFADNQASEWQQVQWLKNCFAYLRETWQYSQLDFVGHSVGGVVGLRYIFDYNAFLDLPKIKRFVAVGAPFNGEVVSRTGHTPYDLAENGPKKYADTFQYLQAYRQNFPTDLQILNIYGDLQNGSRSDGLVTVDSCLSLRYLLPKTIQSYTERKITGVTAQHSLLHENRKVDQYILEFLERT